LSDTNKDKYLLSHTFSSKKLRNVIKYSDVSDPKKLLIKF